MQKIQKILVDIVAAHFWISTSTLNNKPMKYILNKDLPTFKAGTEDGKPVTDHHELYKLGDDWRIEKTMSGYTGECN